MASEVAQLKLDADWVVLSACNTASADKPGAEALSGLARAFIYAGGRSLLVSNWEVDSASAAALMSGTFSAMAADPKLSHGEALRKSMLAMIDDARLITREREDDPTTNVRRNLMTYDNLHSQSGAEMTCVVCNLPTPQIPSGF